MGAAAGKPLQQGPQSGQCNLQEHTHVSKLMPRGGDYDDDGDGGGGGSSGKMNFQLSTTIQSPQINWVVALNNRFLKKWLNDCRIGQIIK